MLIKVNSEKCNGCGACVAICPVEALTLYGKAKVDATRCIGCRMCLTVCPVKAISNR